ncbi:BURP domain-containing protein BNM2A-like [Impatiens glandulifera]|uniref:BURP domain-containing protein BNM2A-like n=1 Tax=Impatiens glandulifera TaxID=253017 RepID=UPI001FB1400C|nr:BURP domain-containing protein BNM2A-like [Impatiens glandulifera]
MNSRFSTFGSILLLLLSLLLVLFLTLHSKVSFPNPPPDNPIEIHNQNHHHNHSSSLQTSDDNLDPAFRVFFHFNELKPGKIMPIYFPIKDPSKTPHLLPRNESDSIPFSSSQLPTILKFFSFSNDSKQAKAMEDTLKHCEFEPLNGERKFCATSLESMMDSAIEIFGPGSRLKVMMTTHVSDHKAAFQNYTIVKVPKEILAPRILACHTLPYPYAVLYCHSQESDNRLFEVSLNGENGERVEATAICHMNTTQWDPDHMAFRVLGIKPGGSPVCHFFPADNLVWIPVP